jgi:YD repeat-containing protein
VADILAESIIPRSATSPSGSSENSSQQELNKAWQNFKARTELVSTLKSILDEEQDTQIISVHPSEDNTVTFTFDNGKTYAVHSDSSYDYARQDGNGDIVSRHVNADGSWMEQVSTADGTPVSSQAVNTDGSWTANTYDPNGYLIRQETTDKDGNVTETTYDAQEAAAYQYLLVS